VVQIVEETVRYVGARGGNRHAVASGGARHRERELAVAGQAHLGQEVEIVFAEEYQARSMLRERPFEARLRLDQSGVEKGDGEAGLPQAGGRQNRLQVRVRLHLPHLLPVEEQVVAVREQYVSHGRLGLPGLTRWRW
jgi:hypothetical protein